jgi:ParB-like chromosome segregation protein Spo0J
MSRPITSTTLDPTRTTCLAAVEPGLCAHPLADAFPLLPDPLLRELAEDVRANGLLEPITIHEGKILDGRCRHAACRLAGVEPRFTAFTGSDPAAFVRSKNIARRDLTPAQRVAAVLKLEDLIGEYRAQASAQRGGRPANGKPRPRADEVSLDVLSRVAGDAGVARSTAAAVAAVKREAPDLFEKVAAGEMEAERAERALRERTALARSAEVLTAGLPATLDLREGDFREVLADVRDVDLVFTDPPYLKEHLPLWSDLGAWAAQALRPGALLIAYSGQYHLLDVATRLGEHLDYLWIGALGQPDKPTLVYQRQIRALWKPYLIFSKGPYEPTRGIWIQDAVSAGPRAAKSDLLHKWQQDGEAARYYIRLLTAPGDLVADPFLGSGTFAQAAYELGRSVVGAELDPVSYATSVARIMH